MFELDLRLEEIQEYGGDELKLLAIERLPPSEALERLKNITGPLSRLMEARFLFMLNRGVEAIALLDELGDLPPELAAAKAALIGANPDVVPAGRPDADDSPVTEESAVEEGAKGGLASKTLAEIYVAQGQTGDAIKIYEELLAENPGSASLAERLAQLRSGGGDTAATPEAAAKDELTCWLDNVVKWRDRLGGDK